jgi:hemerythrin-like domain-containing protein
MKSTNILKDEHKTITRALNVIERMAIRKESGAPLEVRDVEDVLSFLHLYADEHHQGKEEMILFPALLKDRAQRNHKALSQLIFAHNQERSLVVGLEESFRTNRDSDFVYYARRLAQILRAHIESEDRSLFPLADETLAPHEDEEVARELTDFERHWKESVLRGLLFRLSEIERSLDLEVHEAKS